MTWNRHGSIERRSVLAGAAAALWPWQAGAQPPADAVTIGMAAAPSAIDPHYHLLATNMSVAAHMFETLVRQDAQQRPVPGLATAWRLVDPATWEFDLRTGVVFHDGSPFTADDVVFSLNRVPNVPNNPSSYAGQLLGVTDIRRVDDYTVDIVTAGFQPLLKAVT